MNALLVMFVLATTPAKPNPYLAQAKVYYQGLEYEKCLQRLDQAARWRNTPREAVEVELYAGLCKYNLGRFKDAEDNFYLALQLDPDAGLPPFTSPKILALFEEVRARAVAADPSAAPVVDAADTAAPEPGTPDVPKQAEASPVLLPKTSSEGGSALDASLREEPAEGGPRYVAPIALGGAAVVAAAFGGIMGIQARQAETEANAAFYEADAIALGQKAQRNATLANVGFGVALAAATGAVITFLLTDGAEAEPAR